MRVLPESTTDRKFSQNESPREVRVTEAPTSQPQFLRSKDVMARVGLLVSTQYRWMARGAIPKPRKIGCSSYWVTAEVNDWIAKRTAGVPIDLDEVRSS